MVWRSRKAVGPVYMYLNINTSVHVKECHRLFEKSRGHPGTIDCTSKLHSSTLGSRVWGEGDCGQFEFPLRRFLFGSVAKYPIQIQI